MIQQYRKRSPDKCQAPAHCSFLAWFPRLPGLLSHSLHSPPPLPALFDQRMCTHFRRSFFHSSPICDRREGLPLCQKAIWYHYSPARDRKGRALSRGITEEDGWGWILCRKAQETVPALFPTARDKAVAGLSMLWLRKSAPETGASTPWPLMTPAR